MTASLLDWLRRPAFYDVVLALLAVEAIGLSWWHHRHRTGVAPRRLLSFLGAGAAFTLACRGLAADWPSWALAAAMSAAFALHVVHLRASR
ncbi:MAG: hypothetical protein MUF21_05405 [Gemmatimonadaceae bacterium]|nr:hypothetical protein [Gemmatimonadaceae bacterium]